jgi:micrococcal nuclease
VPNKKTNKPSVSKKKIAGVIAGTIIAGSSFFILKSGNHKFILPAYQSIEVYDGDTFMTKEKQNIRLASVDAPERDRCGYKEATKELEKLIKNKPLYLKVRFFDLSKRLVSYVYSPQGSVNVQMAKSGWGRVNTSRDSERDALLEASQYAKEHELGVYSSLCFSKEPEKPGCVIKGNISTKGNTKKYLVPGCTGYPITLVEKDLGDSWFCTEAEAKKAGFERAGGCPITP